jgi:hypothetical protein
LAAGQSGFLYPETEYRTLGSPFQQEAQLEARIPAQKEDGFHEVQPGKRRVAELRKSAISAVPRRDFSAGPDMRLSGVSSSSSRVGKESSTVNALNTPVSDLRLDPSPSSSAPDDQASLLSIVNDRSGDIGFQRFDARKETEEALDQRKIDL